jgi:hypothetical protein
MSVDANIFLDFVNGEYYSAGVGSVDVTELVGQNTGYPGGSGPLVIDGSGLLVLNANSNRPVLIGDALIQLQAATGNNGYVIMMEAIDDGDGLSGYPYLVFFEPAPSAAYTNPATEIASTNRHTDDPTGNAHWDFNGGQDSTGAWMNPNFAGVGDRLTFNHESLVLVVVKVDTLNGVAAMAFNGLNDYQIIPDPAPYDVSTLYLGFSTEPTFRYEAWGHIIRFALWALPLDETITVDDMTYASTIPFPLAPPYAFPVAPPAAGPFLNVQVGDIVQIGCEKILATNVVSSTRLEGTFLG